MNERDVINFGHHLAKQFQMFSKSSYFHAALRSQAFKSFFFLKKKICLQFVERNHPQSMNAKSVPLW